MTAKLHKCEYCGNSFIAKRKTARFCSAKHRVYFNRMKPDKIKNAFSKLKKEVENSELQGVPKKAETAICEHGALREFCNICIKNNAN